MDTEKGRTESLNLKKKILPPFLLGLEPMTIQNGVRLGLHGSVLCPIGSVS